MATGSKGSTPSPALCGIAVMAKASAVGQTKTRLVPPLTYLEAAAFNTAFLQDTAQNILSAASSASIAGYMAYGPRGGEAFFRANIPLQFGIFEASFPNFGDCLYFAVCELLNRSHGSAIVLNSDSPTLPTTLLREAVDVLARPGADVVLGPATDGGYYLLGVKGPHRRLFEEVAWSTSQVAGQTLERAHELGLKVHVLAPWYDVDDAESLRLIEAEITLRSCFNPALQPYEARHTANLLRAMSGSNSLAKRLVGTPLQGGKSCHEPLSDPGAMSAERSQRMGDHVEPIS